MIFVRWATSWSRGRPRLSPSSKSGKRHPRPGRSRPNREPGIDRESEEPMTRNFFVGMAVLVATCGVVAAAPAGAGGGEARQLQSILKRAQQARDLVITEGDEIRLGQAVSDKVRARYGVVQDEAVHRYVTLVGAVLAISSSRPGLPWKFIVLDTDGVNAFAAPGGFIHITRGALALLGSEAELAGVLAHEIIHVTEKHTVKAIQKGKMEQMGAEETLGLSLIH